MKTPLSHLALVGLASLHQVSGHYGFPYLVLDGKVSEKFEYVRGINSFEPLKDYAGIDAMCGTGATPSLFPVKTAKVAAGSAVGFAVTGTLNSGKEHEDRRPFDGRLSIFHYGPATAMLSKAPTDDLDSYQGDGDWFTIQVYGASDGMNWDVPFKGYDRIMNFTIPAATPPGKYLLRAEHLAVHTAISYKQAEMYPACAQIEINGSGTGTPGPMTRFPGAFDAEDPHIWLPRMWQSPSQPMDELKNWPGAGPAVWRG